MQKKQKLEKKTKKRLIFLINLIFLIIFIQQVYALDSALEPTGVKLLHEMGYMGEGKTICMIDSGIDINNPYLVDCVGSDCEILGGYNFIDNNNDLSDISGHGTEIAGVISSDFSKYLGVVPNAKLVVVKVEKNSWNQVKQGIDWCVNNKNTFDPPISVITISKAADEENEIARDIICNLDLPNLQSSIDDAVSNNIPVVMAAGNNYLTHTYDGVDYPACLDNVISVGNVYDNINMININSKRGVDLDLVAPGTDIITTQLGGTFTWDGVSGTSYSTPHVAGGIALLQNYDSALKPFDIERLLKDTGKPIQDYKLDRRIGSNIYDYVPSNRYYPMMDLLSAMNVLDWPTFHHDYRRTGLSLLTGDLSSSTTVSDLTYEGDSLTDYWDNPAFADINGDDEIELVVGTSNDQTYGRVFAIDNDGEQLWSTTNQMGDKVVVPQTPSIADLDGDGVNEVVFGDWDGRINVLIGENGQRRAYIYVPKKDGHVGYVYGTAIADVNLDGKKEIIFTDFYPQTDWPAHIYAYQLSGNRLVKVWDSEIGDSSYSMGSQDNPSIANIDSDDYPEIIIATPYYVQAFNGEDGSSKWKKSYPGAYGSPVIADVNGDNEYEVIVNTKTDYFSISNSYNRTYILDASDGTALKTINHDYRPEGSPAVGHLDSDSYMEIVVSLNNGKYPSADKGRIRSFDGKTGNEEWDYDKSGTLGDLTGSTSIADIDGDNEKEILFATENGDFYVIDEDGNYEWKKTLSSGLWGSPAVGDYDNHKDAEVAVIHYPFGGSSLSIAVVGDKTIKVRGTEFLEIFPAGTNGTIKFIRNKTKTLGSGGALISVLGGINKQPVLSVQSQILLMEGSNITINVSASDADNDTLTFYYSYPFDENGTWETVVNDSGRYEILVTVSDGNLTDSEYIDLFLLRNDSTKLNITNQTFSSNTSVYGEINFSLNNETRIWLADFKIKGEMLTSAQTNYSYADAAVIEYNGWNETNSTFNISNAVDKNDSTYYSAGEATGLIVEMQNLTIPNASEHIIIKLKLRISDGGSGRFGVYNYAENVTEIITSSIPLIEDGWVYFDIHDSDTSLWSTNATHYSYKVDNVNNFINNDSIRWYYRYKYDTFADQRVYESLASFKQEEVYPKNVKIKLNNQTIFEIDELFETTAKTNVFNDSSSNQTLTLSNNSITKYIKIPKDATVTKATISMGNMTTNDINATSISILEEDLLVFVKSNQVGKPQQSGGSGGGTGKYKKNIDHELIYTSDFDVQYDWSSKCYYQPTGSPITEIYTKLDMNDFYWDYDEGKQTIIEGTSLDILLKCYFSDGNYHMNQMKQDTDDRDGNTTYDKAWSDSSSTSPVSKTTSVTITDSTGDIWGLGWTYCKVDKDDHSAWYDAWLYNDCSGSGTAARKGFYIQDCLVLGKNWVTGLNESHIGCADDKECYDPGTSSFANYCRTPICSPSCYEWENETYANHACSCDLAAGRCDTDHYGWENVADDEYCNVTHYPDDTITIECEDWEVAFIQNHTQQCGLGPGRCENASTQINTSHYCDQQNYIQKIHTYIKVNETNVGLNEFAERLELDITNTLNNYLEDCTPDQNNNCIIPILFSSDYNMSTNINFININYETNKIDIEDTLQNSLLNNTEEYNISITSEKGNVSLYDFRIYSSPNTPPRILNESITVTEGDNATIQFDDNERDTLYAEINSSDFYQYNRNLIWLTDLWDAGSYNFTLNVSDGIYTAQKNITVTVNNDYSKDIQISEFGYVTQDSTKNILFFFTAINNNPESQTVNYTLDTGENNITYNFSVTSHKTIVGFVRHNYTTFNDFLVELEVTNGNSTATSTTSVSTKQVKTENLSRLYNYGLDNKYGFVIRNYEEENITNVSWSFNTGESTINSTIPFNLSSLQNIFVIINHGYTSAGEYNVTAAAKHDQSTDFQTITINLVPVTLSTYSILSLAGTEAVFEIVALNEWNESLTGVTWEHESGESNITSNNFNLSLGEDIFVFVYHNYSASGNYSTKATAKYESYSDSQELILGVE